MVIKSDRKRMVVVAAALSCALLLAAAPVLAGSSSLAVQKTIQSGAIVQVTVKNFSTTAATGTVAVQAMVGDTPIWSYVPVAVAGGKCATVSAAFTATPSKVMSVGVTDDMNPF